MSPLFIKEFGALMKVTRLKRKLSYEQLSEKMEYPKAKSTLKRYEDGVAKKLDFLTIRDICDVLMLDVNKVIDVFEKTGRLDQEDLELHGTLNNSQIANIQIEVNEELPDSFFINYANLSEEHKKTILQITSMYAAEDSKGEN